MKTTPIKKMLQILAIGAAAVSLSSCNTENEDEGKTSKSNSLPRLDVQSLQGLFHKVAQKLPSQRNQDQAGAPSREEMIRSVRESELLKGVDQQQLADIEARFRNILSRVESEMENYNQGGPARGYDEQDENYENPENFNGYNRQAQGYYR